MKILKIFILYSRITEYEKERIVEAKENLVRAFKYLSDDVVLECSCITDNDIDSFNCLTDCDLVIDMYSNGNLSTAFHILAQAMNKTVMSMNQITDFITYADKLMRVAEKIVRDENTPLNEEQ